MRNAKLLKIRVSEISVKQIRINQGVSVIVIQKKKFWFNNSHEAIVKQK